MLLHVPVPRVGEVDGGSEGLGGTKAGRARKWAKNPLGKVEGGGVGQEALLEEATEMPQGDWRSKAEKNRPRACLWPASLSSRLTAKKRAGPGRPDCSCPFHAPPLPWAAEQAKEHRLGGLMAGAKP